MPGKVSVAPNSGQHRQQQHHVQRQRHVGEQAEQAVAQDHEQRHQAQARQRRIAAGLDRIRAQFGADGAFFQDLQRRRQRAGAQQDGQVVGVLGGEAAGDAARAAQDRRSGCTGALITFLSSTMAKRWPTCWLGDVAELLGAHAVEAEIRLPTGRSAGRSPGWHRSGGRPTPARGAAPRSWRRPCWRAWSRAAAGFRRRSGATAALGSACSSTSWKVILAVLPSMALSWRGVLQARHFHHDAVVARTGDGGLLGAQRVDAAAHHFDRLVQHLLAGQGLEGVAHVQRRTRRRPARSCHTACRRPPAPKCPRRD